MPVRLDVNTFIGAYPFRHVPHPDPEILVKVLAREGIRRAWVGHLPSAFWRDPAHGNAQLYAALAPHGDVLRPAPCVRPDWPAWERAVREATERGAPAVRVYPPQWGLAPDDRRLIALGDACADAGLAVLLTVKFEDGRQRHPMDVAGDLAAPAIRALVRGSRARVVVTAAGRELIEETHWSLTEAERERLFWDISWIWGPPEDHLARLLRTVGGGRFVYGTMWPLRLTQAPAANLALLPDDLKGAELADLEATNGSPE